jgi:uncharacterized membrane protein YhaH (DUF805 family)
MALYNLLFGFEGRFGRAMWWGLGLASGFILFFAVNGGTYAWDLWQDNDEIGGLRTIGIAASFLAAILVAFAAAVSTCAVGVRRLHDRNKSGIWLVLLYGVPALVWLLPCDLLDEAPALLLTIANAAVLVWQMVELGFLRGTIGANDYGPDPLIYGLQEPGVADPGWPAG